MSKTGLGFKDKVAQVFAQYHAWLIDCVSAERIGSGDVEFLLMKLAELEERIERFEEPPTEA